MTRRDPEVLTVPPGVELNYGCYEDSDFVVTIAPTTLVIAGELRCGALPVRLMQDGKPSNEIFYYHQPEPQTSQQ